MKNESLEISLLDMVQREPRPAPWSEGDNIPWSDPAFSRRMLNEHLSQQHDAASRRLVTIDKHVDWIHCRVLREKPSRILDLGCGPGLYASRLAKLGHTCVGIDFSPASIQYAIEQTKKENLNCTYVHGDIRYAEFGTGYDLAMLIFGEFNVFCPADAKLILEKANRALRENGVLVLEPHPFSVVKKLGDQPATWYSTMRGLFSDEPHILLNDSFWDAETKTTTHRYFVIDASSGQVTRYSQTFQSYTDEQYRAMLIECGFDRLEFYPALGADSKKAESDLIALVARKSPPVA